MALGHQPLEFPMRIGISCYSTFGGRGPIREPEVSGSTGLDVLCDMGVVGGAAGTAALDGSCK